MPESEFDLFADSYDEELERGLALTGEDKLYYATLRILATQRVAVANRLVPRRVLDYGCGTGTAAPLLERLLGADLVLGVDPSERSLARARAEQGSPRRRFASLDGYHPDASHDLALTNGVFHHIPVADRPAAARYVWESLRPGGLFALWDNNPLNPGTRWVMRQVAFDRDAIMLRSGEAIRLLQGAGFDLVGVEYHFVFPRLLRWLRGLEPLLRSVPLGGQYLVVGRRPG
jgi:SAM-dependent methyltransferase